MLDGTADVQGPNLSLQVSANQTATIVGTGTFLGSIGPAQRDAFLDARLAAERPPQHIAAAIPQQVAVMPGGSEVIENGSWSAAPEYGQVWYPPVSPGWVPYRHGHWAYVAPWGWTWVNDASWGFAPFHYGRWLQLDGRWAWTPGAALVGPPVYAPALVAFIGIGAGVAIGAALTAGSVGWVPLGPHEVFHPWYRASDAYVRQVNISHVTNMQTINNTNVTVNNFINRGAATQVPAAALTGSRPIQGIAQPVTEQQFAAARPVIGQQPLSPTAATAGVTGGGARDEPVPGRRAGPLAGARSGGAGGSVGTRVPAKPRRTGRDRCRSGRRAGTRNGGFARRGGASRCRAPGNPRNAACRSPRRRRPRTSPVRSRRQQPNRGASMRAPPREPSGSGRDRGGPSGSRCPGTGPSAGGCTSGEPSGRGRAGCSHPQPRVAPAPHAAPARTAFAAPAGHAAPPAPRQVAHAAAPAARAEPAQHHERRPGER